jgi:hypothetical protein
VICCPTHTPTMLYTRDSRLMGHVTEFQIKESRASLFFYRLFLQSNNSRPSPYIAPVYSLMTRHQFCRPCFIIQSFAQRRRQTSCSNIIRHILHQRCTLFDDVGQSKCLKSCGWIVSLQLYVTTAGAKSRKNPHSLFFPAFLCSF